MPRRRYPHASFIPPKITKPVVVRTDEEATRAMIQRIQTQNQAIKTYHRIYEEEARVAAIKAKDKEDAEKLKPWCPRVRVERHRITLNEERKCMQCVEDDKPFMYSDRRLLEIPGPSIEQILNTIY